MNKILSRARTEYHTITFIAKQYQLGGLSNGSVSGDEEEERHITQYHYLAWMDFIVPELGLIRFIHQINDVYSVQRGLILVHCSGDFKNI